MQIERKKDNRRRYKLVKMPMYYPDGTRIVIAIWRHNHQIVASDIWETFRLTHDWGHPLNDYPSWLAEAAASHGVSVADGALYSVRGPTETVWALAYRVASAAQKLAQMAWYSIPGTTPDPGSSSGR